jgi:predicted dehydrogenase
MGQPSSSLGVAAPDIDVVSVVVANHLHREIVAGLLAGGKHVLCEKPLAPTIEDGEADV